MAREIIINSAPFETRVALVERQRLTEVFIERAGEHGVVGNIYKGRVTRVLPGMQAAFVDVGLDKAAFLHVSDLDPDLRSDVFNEDNITVELVGPQAKVSRRPIEERLKKGNEIVVQVAKEPIGSKGARVTGILSLPGRYLVFSPSANHVGVSRRIENEEERTRLKDIIVAERPAEGGFIIRTACEGLTKKEIQGDVRSLVKLWKRVQKKATLLPAPALLHSDLDLTLRTVRDLFTTETSRIVVDNRRDFERIHDFLEIVMPRLRDRVELYDETEPIFERFGLEAQLNRALERRVWLKSGGYIVIDHAEALTVIDVNTGRYVGKRNQNETVLRTNLEATKIIVEQIRLRNIGGIIVIDFIDMEDLAHRRDVFEALRDALRADKARSRLLPISELGLIEMTRKRSRESLAQTLCVACTTCEGAALVKSPVTIAFEILRRLEHEAARNPLLRKITVEVHPEIAHHLQQHEERTLAKIHSRYDVEIVLKGNPSATRTQYEIQSVEAAA